MKQPIDICKEVASASTQFEENTSKLKRLYFYRNISRYNSIVSTIKGYRGSFGTGYPFYAFDPSQDEQIPVIKEQIRYNNGLIEAVNKSEREFWTCAECLEKQGHTMPDLKQICKPCPNMDNELKPRKVINRLPDIDMWMVCSKEDISDVMETLIRIFAENNFFTSDVDPIKTIQDMFEINSDLMRGQMPEKNLPIDAHIMDYDILYSLIECIPGELQSAKEEGRIPYLPIHPISYRKKWQYDDTAYNFVHDFLYAFTQYNFEGDLQQLLLETRRKIASDYTVEELQDYAIRTGSESVLRRQRTKNLQNKFRKRVESWKK